MLLPGSGERKVLIEQGPDIGSQLTYARYVPSGHIVYARSGVLFAVAFDLQRLAVVGNPSPVVQGVRRAALSLESMFSFSDNGSLVYIPGPISTTTESVDLVIAGRDGAMQRLALPPRPYQTPRVSPDDKRIAFGIDHGNEANVWTYDLSGSNAMSRLTFGGKNRFPVWSPDGQRIAFQSDREGDLGIYLQQADGRGVAERLTKAEEGASHVPESWSPDGNTLLFRVTRGSSVASLWTFSLRDKVAGAFGGLESATPPNAVFSPDGQWVAYQAQEQRQNLGEVYVQPFPATGARYQLPLSRDNHHPVWSRDGKELFYIPGPGEYAAIPVTATAAFAFGNPVPVRRGLETRAPTLPRQYDVTPDGRFVGPMTLKEAQPGVSNNLEIHVVLNWFSELQQRVPMK